jgi:hypothetical protein
LKAQALREQQIAHGAPGGPVSHPGEMLPNNTDSGIPQDAKPKPNPAPASSLFERIPALGTENLLHFGPVPQAEGSGIELQKPTVNPLRIGKMDMIGLDWHTLDLRFLPVKFPGEFSSSGPA